MDKCRAEFEEIYNKIYAEKKQEDIKNGRNVFDLRDFSFLIWQASRAAIKVELPNPVVAHYGFETLYTEDVCNMLTDAGISYE